MFVYTLNFVSDGEHDLRVYSTAEARDRALLVEALERRDADKEIGAVDETEWPVARVIAEPVEFIVESSFSELDVKTDDLPVLEG